MCALAYLYEYDKVADKDEYDSVKLYRMAIKRFNDVVAMNALGWCYSKGIGVVKNINKAIEQYTKASAAGYLPATCNLGVNYQLKKDFVKAAENFRIATEGEQKQCLS